MFASTAFVSCDNVDTDNVSKVTNYPLITVLGDDPVFVSQGGLYEESGAIAIEGTNEIPYTTTIAGDYRDGTSVDTDIIDGYNVNYTATNVDGFKIAASRKVWVYNNGDLVNSIEGIYTSTVVRGGASSAQYTDMGYVLIWKNEDGTYEMSDGLGGYYNIGRDYGVTYAARPVIITANDIPSNDFSVPDFSVGDFGGNAVMTLLTVNPDSKTISFTSTWDGSANGTFEVTLTQVQP